MMHQYLLFLSLCVSTLSFVIYPDSLTGANLVDYVNNAQTQFTLKHQQINDILMTSRYMDDKYRMIDTNTPIKSDVSTSIPSTFDARTQWPKCTSIGTIMNQGGCKAGWAIAATGVMTDRLCIHTNQTWLSPISADDVLTCCSSACGDGCDGGYPIQAFRYYSSKGIVTGGAYQGTGCRPYQVPPCDHPNKICEKDPIPFCDAECQNNWPVTYKEDKHYGASAYAVDKTVAAIQTEIMTNGPVEGVFTIYEDFNSYESGIYKHTSGKYDGTQAVRIIGWGTDNGHDYWLCANSWGTTWGESGFFRIRRGKDECGIESAVVAGMPKIF